MIGKKFGRWTVIKKGKKNRGGQCWICKCDCGNIKSVYYNNLKSKKSQSCGCLRKERSIASSTKHGMRNSRIYRIWGRIKNRCLKENSRDYHIYGGRGIKICKEWEDSFEAFYKWAIENDYSDDLQIDREDNDGDYEPSNCRWTTQKENARNRRTNILFEYNGKTKCMIEWAEEYDIPYYTLYHRLRKRNWSIEKALTTPLLKKK